MTKDRFLDLIDDFTNQNTVKYVHLTGSSKFKRETELEKGMTEIFVDYRNRMAYYLNDYILQEGVPEEWPNSLIGTWERQKFGDLPEIMMELDFFCSEYRLKDNLLATRSRELFKVDPDSNTTRKWIEKDLSELQRQYHEKSALLKDNKAYKILTSIPFVIALIWILVTLIVFLTGQTNSFLNLIDFDKKTAFTYIAGILLSGPLIAVSFSKSIKGILIWCAVFLVLAVCLLAGIAYLCDMLGIGSPISKEYKSERKKECLELKEQIDNIRNSVEYEEAKKSEASEKAEHRKNADFMNQWIEEWYDSLPD